MNPQRTTLIPDSVIAFSISFQRENLLSRGMGLEHLRELLIRLARLILRQGASLAYGGHWEETEDNFTFELLRLINSEQEDNSIGGPDTNFRIGKLYNHSPWPRYLKITPQIEAQWINCCRIVRITQQLAGIAEDDIVPDSITQDQKSRYEFNKAVTLSAMRRLMMEAMAVNIPDVQEPEIIPPVVARILLGGKVDDYSGFLPGIFEEALFTLQKLRPLYVLGGFGGATEILARAMLGSGVVCPEEFTLDYQKAHNPALAPLLESSKNFSLPQGFLCTEEALKKLFALVMKARSDLSGTLNTGLDDRETRELLTTRDVANAVRLVRKGLIINNKLPNLPA
jgi:hypothetical protein